VLPDVAGGVCTASRAEAPPSGERKAHPQCLPLHSSLHAISGEQYVWPELRKVTVKLLQGVLSYEERLTLAEIDVNAGRHLLKMGGRWVESIRNVVLTPFRFVF
jgi:hypothetical protein